MFYFWLSAKLGRDILDWKFALISSRWRRWTDRGWPPEPEPSGRPGGNLG